MSETQTTYNYKVVRQFAVMTVIWASSGCWSASPPSWSGLSSIL